MPSMVKLDFDPRRELLFILNADEEVIRHPFLAGYIRSAGGIASEDGVISIRTASSNLRDHYQSIEKILIRIGSGLEKGNYLSEVLSEIENEEQKFADFSRQAYEIWQSQIDTEDFRSFAEAVTQSCTGRPLYRKQLLAAFHLAFSQNACNFSVPGAGKTSIVYAAYAYLKSLPNTSQKAINRLLIVGPLASFKAWEDEYEGIFGHRPKSIRISGAMPQQARSDYLRGISPGSLETEITLTTYQTLANSEEDFRAFLNRPHLKTMMVLDEAHYIKSSDGFWASAALELAPLASSRVILTGTPAPNGYEDLANLFKFIYPNKQIIGFPPATLRAMTDGSMPRAIPELKSAIRPFYTRIRKTDLGLPDASEIRIPVGMGAAQEAIYRSLERKILPQIRQDLDNHNSPIRVKARIIRLRQACVNPKLLLRPLEEEGLFDISDTGDLNIAELEVGSLIRDFNATSDLERLSICRDLVLKILSEQGKVLIWSYFIGNLEQLATSLKDDAPFVELLTGKTPVDGGYIDDESGLETREKIIDRFHSTRGRAILIANPQAVGESISLHKACRSAIYFDRDFNAGRFIQSKDRIHRYNPDGGEAVTYYHLVCRGTVDIDIDSRLTLKEKRLADLVDSEDIPLFTADFDDMEDIRAILESYESRKGL